MPEAERPEQPGVVRLCVDLNIWVRHLLGLRKGGASTAPHAVIVEAVRSGRCPAGPVQLIVSHPMLSRLEDVLLRLGFSPGDAASFSSLIGAFARRGPYGIPPHIVLGGGTSPTAESRMPVYNPYDPTVIPPRADDEDGWVLDTALAGRAHLLATYNLRDFQTPDAEVLEDGRLLAYRTAQRRLLIADARRTADFLQHGRFPHPGRDSAAPRDRRRH